MICYRVSRNVYKAGDSIWEDGKKHEAASNNVSIFKTLVEKEDEQSIFQLLTKYNDPKVYNAYTESALEHIQESEFAHHPSRRASMMVFHGLKDAVAFNVLYRNNEANIYEIEYEGTKEFQGDMRLFDNEGTYSIQDQLTTARKYWSGEVTENPFMESYIRAGISVKIVKQITI